MANIQSAKKRARQADKRNLDKSAQRAEIRTLIKRVEEAIQQKNIKIAKDLFLIMQKKLDKSANKKVLPKNQAARQKARLSKAIKSLA
tara:strand:- start:16681 stop:16944 length:264 start_codon:yes stop_codon:yes gene_type:complete